MAPNNSKRHRKTEIEGTDVSDVQVDVFLSAAEKLPAEMYYQIFQYVDKKSLAESRAVCLTWLNAIDDNPKLLKFLVFTIHDIKTFLQSHLARKVKSIRIIQPLKGTEKALEKFFSKIASTVEEVYLNFGEHLPGISKARRTERQKLMLSMVLRFCTKLNSLTIASEDYNYDFIKDCCEDPRNAVGLSLVQRLSINVRRRYLPDLKKFVLNLPNLRFLGLSSEDVGYLGGNKLVDLIIDRLSKYNGNLQEILLKHARSRAWPSEPLIPLLLLVGQRYPKTIINAEDAWSLGALVNYKETENAQITEITCKDITNGYFRFGCFNKGINTTKIGLCSNLQSLDLEFRDKVQISPMQLEFMKELKKLNHLKMKDSSSKIGDKEYTILQSSEALKFDLPSLNTLEFYGEGLGLNSISFPLCFPNLSKLYIRKFSGVLNEDFIFNLTNLDQLRSLTLQSIDKLTDEHLTRVYDFSAENGQISKLPAIAGFKSLKHLHIANCHKLTNKSLKNGLEFCSKLDKITLCFIGCRKGERFTNAGLDSLQQAGNYSVEDLPPCHGRKHVGIVTKGRSLPPFQFTRFTK